MNFKVKSLHCFLCMFAICVTGILCSDDLYNVLGVGKSASQREIRQAYKSQAREWHPDKNKDPSAADRFTKINEAYETLGDSERRKEYDQFGYTSAQKPLNQHQQDFHGFDQFFRASGFRFHFGGGYGGESIIDKYDINLRYYLSKIVPESYKKPCILYTYADFCINCMRIEHFIEKFINELDSVGICIGTFHARMSGGLSSHLRIDGVPTIMAVVSGRIRYFKWTVSMQSLRDFARSLFPSKTLTELTDTNYKDFLNGWIDNKVQAIFYAQKAEPSARFLATAFYYNEYVSFGYVHAQSPHLHELIHRYSINRNRETLLMFNEETSSPVAAISMQHLSRTTMDEVISANKFLLLPRLSSQKHFDELCPEEFKAKKRKLCVVLLSKKCSEHDDHRESFRVHSQISPLSRTDRIRYAYVYEDVQQNVVEALTKGNNTAIDKALKVVILWRMEKNRLSYDWLDSGWNSSPDEVEKCSKALDRKLDDLLKSDHLMSYRTILPEFHNEHTLHLFLRIFNKLTDWYDRIYFYMTSNDSVTWISITLSVLFLFGMGFFMQKMAGIEEEQVANTKPPKTRARPPSRSADNRSLQVYELRDDTYDDLVKQANTGLTITVLVDEESKEKLIQKFAGVMNPYSRYSALSFAFVQLEYYIDWYRLLLEESLGKKVKLDNINLRNCVGTVLAINGYRKYYYIYHAKRARKWMRETNNISKSIGFFDSDTESDTAEDQSANKFFIEELLDGLSMWMDRIFDGSVQKIRVNYWPEISL